jgi:hypothetical protein
MVGCWNWNHAVFYLTYPGTIYENHTGIITRKELVVQKGASIPFESLYSLLSTLHTTVDKYVVRHGAQVILHISSGDSAAFDLVLRSTFYLLYGRIKY